MRTRNLVVALAMIATLAVLSPAFGGSERAGKSASAQKTAKKALRLARQALNASKAPGPAGEPGSAVAYAFVDPVGNVNTALSKNVGAGAVTKPAGSPVGVYCFNLSFTPKSAVVSLADSTAGITAGFVGAQVGPICAGNNDAEVVVYGTNGIAADRAFSVIFN